MRFALLICIGLLAGCQAALPTLPEWQSPQGRDAANLGQIKDLRSGELLTASELVERLSAAGQVLIGEQHDNPDHHALELWLLRAMASQREQGSIVLEMLTSSQQSAVDEAQKTLQAGQPIADLAKQLDWQQGWDWSMYGPIVRYALEQRANLLAANLDRAEMMQIYRKQPVLSGSASTAQAVREPLLEQIRESHCGLLPDSQLPAMLVVQQQRDRRMAERLQQADKPAVLLAGAFHVRRDLGVPVHLRDLGDSTINAVLIFSEVGKPVSADQADYVWYTAAVEDKDHCAELRKP
ncbi:ChaN family lipoprotein [Pseudomonas sp. EL_65y_Pfl2_R95]|uniref:ChaN family lipoprotein n=1 Tax=Pseudomonas sp. EL_65y_Pfl2_R95 TaxID=3088698 RepID=UPI0030DBF13C